MHLQPVDDKNKGLPEEPSVNSEWNAVDWAETDL